MLFISRSEISYVKQEDVKNSQYMYQYFVQVVKYFHEPLESQRRIIRMKKQPKNK